MLNKYLATLRSGLHQQLIEKQQLIGRIFLYLVIIYLFFQVFQTVHADYTRLWYYAATQIVILSASSVAFQIGQDIQNGYIVNFLLSPMPYLYFRFFESLGSSLLRFCIFSICGCSLCFYLTGQLPSDALNLIGWFIVGPMAIVLYTLMSLLIGLTAFWIRDIKNIFYLNLTATFGLGGLIVPLEFYSQSMQTVSFLTPYPWILWLPAGWITGSVIHLPSALLGWSLWFFFLIFLIRFVYSKFLRLLMAEGV